MPCTLNAIFAHGNLAIENEQGNIIDPCSPVWTPEINVKDGQDNSFFPALFVSGHADTVLTLNVELGDELAGRNVQLVAYLNGRMMFRTDPSDGITGLWSPDAHVTFNVGELARVAGDLEWYLQGAATGNPEYVGSTRVELTWIYQQPAAMFENLSQAKVLRLVFGAIDAGASRDDVVADLTRVCYYWFNKVYDVVNGAPSYGSLKSGGAFELGDYLLSISQPQDVNCYDQAAMLQTLLGSIGVQHHWLSMEPFGHIKPVDMVGVRACNNPFFGSNHSQPMVGANDPERTWLRNHAFIQAGSAVLDACAGPVMGENTLKDYLAEAIDARVKAPDAGLAGSMDDVATGPGVSSLHFAPRASENPQVPPEMEAILGPKEELLAQLPASVTTLDWKVFIRSLCAEHRLTLLNRSITPACDGVFSRWTLEGEDRRVTVIRVFIAQKSETALARALDYLGSFQNSPAQCLSRHDELGAAGLISHDGKLVMSVHNNVFALVRGDKQLALAVARDIYQAIETAPPRYRRTAFTHETLTLRPGECKTLQTASVVRHSLNGTAVRLTGRRSGELNLRGQQAGASSLRLANIDEATLEMHLHQVRFEVAA
jgi:hypothetical protein